MIYVLLTYLFYPILYLVMLFKKFPPLAKGGKGGFSNSTEFKKILVIQTAKIGDMICSTPVFREIKKKYPSVILSVIASPVTAELLKYNPYVDEVVELDTKNIKGVTGKIKLANLLYKGRYDTSLSLNPNIPFTIAPLWALIPVRIAIMPNFCGTTLKIAYGFNTHNVRHETGRLVSETYMKMLEPLNIQTKDISKEVYKPSEADRKAEEFLSRLSVEKCVNPRPTKEDRNVTTCHPEFISGSKEMLNQVQHDKKKGISLIGVAVSSGNKLKELGVDTIVSLINELMTNSDLRVILIGSEADKKTAQEILKISNKKELIIDSTGVFSLSELPALVKRLSLFIGVDTGITYMADAMLIPIIDIAGPSDMSDQRPLGKNTRIIQKDISCVPCSHVFKSPYSCKRGDRICITSVDVSEIIESVKKLLNPSFPRKRESRK